MTCDDNSIANRTERGPANGGEAVISLPQIQFACDLCEERVEVEIETTYLGSQCDFYFDADEWMAENDWMRMDGCEIRCPRHEARPGVPRLRRVPGG